MNLSQLVFASFNNRPTIGRNGLRSFHKQIYTPKNLKEGMFIVKIYYIIMNIIMKMLNKKII